MAFHFKIKEMSNHVIKTWPWDLSLAQNVLSSYKIYPNENYCKLYYYYFVEFPIVYNDSNTQMVVWSRGPLAQCILTDDRVKKRLLLNWTQAANWLSSHDTTGITWIPTGSKDITFKEFYTSHFITYWPSSLMKCIHSFATTNMYILPRMTLFCRPTVGQLWLVIKLNLNNL